MQQKKVTVTIDPLGNPVVEAHGFKGQGCEAATKAIEDALAGEGGAERTYKPEWSQPGGTNQQEIKQGW